MNIIHSIDIDGFLVETNAVPHGIEIISGIKTAIPNAPLVAGKAWRWVDNQWVQNTKPFFSEKNTSKKFTQSEWLLRNGLTGYKILAATKTDPLAQYFHEVMKAEEIVSTADTRLAIAYGYFVGAGYITQEEADRVCGFEVEPLTAAQVQEKMEASSGNN
jgi:hypothetical protein